MMLLLMTMLVSYGPLNIEHIRFTDVGMFAHQISTSRACLPINEQHQVGVQMMENEYQTSRAIEQFHLHWILSQGTSKLAIVVRTFR